MADVLYVKTADGPVKVDIGGGSGSGGETTSIETLTYTITEEATTAQSFLLNAFVHALVFVNSVLAVEGVSYGITGGTVLQFSEVLPVGTEITVVKFVTNGSVTPTVSYAIDSALSATSMNAVQNKVVKLNIDSLQSDIDSLQSDIDSLQSDIDSLHPSDTPVGTVMWFAASAPPAGYLVCNGAAVSRTAYAELFSVVGTTFGAGDGSTTFGLPNLIDRVAQGSVTVGTAKEAGLPNIEGALGGITTNPNSTSDNRYSAASGPFSMTNCASSVGPAGNSSWWMAKVTFDASDASEIYGNSDTVQPPALTLLPCIKAFDDAVNPGLIDITELAQEMADKADTGLSNVTSAAATNLDAKGIRTVVATYRNGTSWYRKWSDGWVEQGGYVYPKTTSTATVTLTLPYANTDYTIMVVGVYSTNHGEVVQNSNKTTTSFNTVAGYASNFGVYWWTAGQGAS